MGEQLPEGVLNISRAAVPSEDITGDRSAADTFSSSRSERRQQVVGCLVAQRLAEWPYFD